MSIDMTFWRRFAPDILSGKKTITIRDKHESAFAPGDVLRVGYDDDGQYFCTLVIECVTPTDISHMLAFRSFVKDLLHGIRHGLTLHWIRRPKFSL